MGYFTLILIVTVYLIRPAEWIPALYFNWNLLLNGFAVLFLLGSITAKNKPNSLDRTSLFMVWFLCAMITSNLVRFQLQTIPGYFPSMFSTVIVFFLVQLSITKKTQIDNFIIVLIVLILFICYQCFLQIITGSNWGGLEPMTRSLLSSNLVVGTDLQIRWFGIFHDPNDLGLVLVFFVPYMVNKIFFQKNRISISILWIAITIVFVYTIILTNSRGTMLALIASLVSFFIIKHKSLYGIIAAGIISLALLAFAPSRMGEVASGDYSAMGRVYAWILALNLFALNPIFGVGADHFMDYHGYTTHNSFVLAFVENGLFGFIPYFGLFILVISTSLKVAYKEHDSLTSIEIISLASGLIGVCVSIFFISRTYVLTPYLYLVIVISYLRVYSPDLYYSQLLSLSLFKLFSCSISFIIFLYVFNRMATTFLI